MCEACGLDLADSDSITLPVNETLPPAALILRPERPDDAVGEFHRRCAAIARTQRRSDDQTICAKHGVPLDDTGWCPTCRERVT
jgi:hypothetical protein